MVGGGGGGGGAGRDQTGRGFVCSGAATSSWIGRVSFTTRFHDGEARDGRVRMSVRMWEVESRDSL